MELPGVKPVLRPFGLWPVPLPGPASPFWRPSLNHLLFPDRQPWFYGWGFNLPRGQALLEKWNLIPEGVDILITHGPPLGKSQLAASAGRAPQACLVWGRTRGVRGWGWGPPGLALRSAWPVERSPGQALF